MGEESYQWDGLMVNFMGLYWVKNDGIPSSNDCYIAIGYLAMESLRVFPVKIVDLSGAMLNYQKVLEIV